MSKKPVDLFSEAAKLGHQQTGQIVGQEFVGILGGGEAAGGQYVWLKLRVGAEDQTVIIEKSKVASLMMGLATVASMAHKARLAANPDEDKAGSIDVAYALNLAEARVGSSTDGETAIIDLGIDARLDRTANLFIAAKRPALLRLRAAVARALLKLNNANAAAKAN